MEIREIRVKIIRVKKIRVKSCPRMVRIKATFERSYLSYRINVIKYTITAVIAVKINPIMDMIPNRLWLMVKAPGSCFFLCLVLDENTVIAK